MFIKDMSRSRLRSAAGSNPGGGDAFLIIWECGILRDPVPCDINSEKKCGFQDTWLVGVVISSARSDSFSLLLSSFYGIAECR